MKFRNNWVKHKPNYKALTIKIRISIVDLFSLEIDPTRNFYGLTILNFMIKNR